VYEEGSSADLKEAMESHEWTIKVIQQVEESNFNRSFSNVEDVSVSENVCLYILRLLINVISFEHFRASGRLTVSIFVF